MALESARLVAEHLGCLAVHELVGEPMAGDLMARRVDAAHQLRRLFGDPAEHEERGLDVGVGEQLQQPLGALLRRGYSIGAQSLREMTSDSAETWK